MISSRVFCVIYMSEPVRCVAARCLLLIYCRDTRRSQAALWYRARRTGALLWCAAEAGGCSLHPSLGLRQSHRLLGNKCCITAVVNSSSITALLAICHVYMPCCGHATTHVTEQGHYRMAIKVSERQLGPVLAGSCSLFCAQACTALVVALNFRWGQTQLH